LRYRDGLGPGHDRRMVSAEESSSPVPGALEARLSAAQIDLLRPHGAERATARGEVLFREGDGSYDFLVILVGTVAAVDGYGAAERELGPGGTGCVGLRILRGPAGGHHGR
jgi:hypothetical protein